jgi:hypothetical protein
MRRGAELLLLVGALASLLAGCLTDEPHKTSRWAEQFRRFSLSANAHIVQMEIRLLEMPLGDSYINTEVWKYTDEQVVDLDSKAILDDNGFRVGRIVGSVPAGLHALLTSDRSCINPHCLIRAEGREMPIQLSPVLDSCRFCAQTDRKTNTIDLASAQCSFSVVANFTDDGRTRLQFTPRIDFGEDTSTFHAAEDLSGWVHEFKKPSRTFPELRWQVTVAPNEFLLIGCQLTQQESLGYQSLVDRSSRAPVQHLLVLRTGRTGAAGIDAEIPQGPTNPDSPQQALPLALQAATKRAPVAAR